MIRSDAILVLNAYKRQCRLRNVVEAIDIALTDMTWTEAEKKAEVLYEQESNQKTSGTSDNKETKEASKEDKPRLGHSVEGATQTSETAPI